MDMVFLIGLGDRSHDNMDRIIIELGVGVAESLGYKEA
jgi:hypothetical protein